MTALSTGPILALDTASDEASVAVVDAQGQALAQRQWQSCRRHTVELAPIVRELLLEAGVTAGDLAAVAVAIGPGSYTGLRIGLALAKGIALVAGCPVVGIPTLDIVAAACTLSGALGDGDLLAVVVAGRGRLIAGRYPVRPVDGDVFNGPRPVDWPDPATTRAQPPEAILEMLAAPAWVAGELTPDLAAALEARGLSALPLSRDPRLLARLARGRLAAGWLEDPFLSPVYAS